MKKYIYERIVEIYIEEFGNRWFSMYDDYCTLYMPENLATEVIKEIKNFDELCDFVESGEISGAITTETLFRKRKQVKIRIFESFETFYITKKNFKSIKIRSRYEKRNFHTFEYLMKNLNSEQFIEYCKDRNFLFNSSFKNNI